ncbi:MAG: DNA internalization-related competence protein ComEC/Rec2 [Lachnospiraceae bacterium]|nr:DNA internalization-related competence protein ComEC/Rec2 [Lachnospiraceae bacterium]
MNRIKRPLLCGCLVLIAVIVLIQRLVDPPPWEPQLPRELTGQPLTVIGQVYEKEVRTLYGQEILYLYLQSVTVSSDAGSGDKGSVPEFSEYNIEEKLICQLAADQAAWESTSAGNDTARGAGNLTALEAQICLGSRVAVCGELELYSHATNPGEWDSAGYYLITGVAGRLKQAQLLGIDGGRWRFREALRRCRTRLKNRLYQALPQQEASVLARMLLAEKYGMDQDIKELYQKNGISHVLAISGLHITLLGMGLYRLLRRCGCPIAPAAIAGGGMILLYGGMIGWGISAVRAIGMYLIRMLGEVWGKHYDMLTAMGVLAAGMVCGNPRIVYHSGFLLSFGAVAGMGVMYPALAELVPGKCKGLSASLSVTLATLPIQLYFFYQIPVYGTLLNLIVLPLMSLLLAGGLVLMVLPGAVPVQWIVQGILALYEGLCRLAERLPGHLWITGRPERWQIGGYYLLLTAAFIGLKQWRAAASRHSAAEPEREKSARVWRCRLIPLKGLLLMLTAVLLLTRRWDKGFSLTMLDVGQGDCICVRTARGQTYLFDGGSSSRSRVGEYVLVPYLKSQGISRVEGIFVSHGDQDHMNAVKELLTDSDGIRLDTLYLPQLAQPQPEALEELAALAREADCRVVYLSRGMGWQQGDFRLTCLWPLAGYAGESNASSACYLLEEGGFRVLLTGDVEGEGETAVTGYLQSLAISSVDVLKVAHHGSRYSTSDSFLQAVSPRLALISAGRDNSYGHPHAELLERLERAGCLILQTPESGAVTVRISGKKEGEASYRKVIE